MEKRIDHIDGGPVFHHIEGRSVFVRFREQGDEAPNLVSKIAGHGATARISRQSDFNAATYSLIPSKDNPDDYERNVSGPAYIQAFSAAEVSQVTGIPLPFSTNYHSGGIVKEYAISSVRGEEEGVLSFRIDQYGYDQFSPSYSVRIAQCNRDTILLAGLCSEFERFTGIYLRPRSQATFHLVPMELFLKRPEMEQPKPAPVEDTTKTVEEAAPSGGVVLTGVEITPKEIPAPVVEAATEQQAAAARVTKKRATRLRAEAPKTVEQRLTRIEARLVMILKVLKKATGNS